jgi:hypothetical protein
MPVLSHAVRVRVHAWAGQAFIMGGCTELQAEGKLARGT